MKIKLTQLLAGLSIGLLLSASWAQAQTCNAKVSKRTITLNESEESTWDIIFDVAAPGCDNSAGKFDYVVELSDAGKTVTQKKTTEFSTENGQRTAIIVSHSAKPGQEVKNVSGVFVRECTCRKPGL
jgi:hypothetical protein